VRKSFWLNSQKTVIVFANAKSDILRMQSDICPFAASDIFPCGKVEEEIEIEIATANASQ